MVRNDEKKSQRVSWVKSEDKRTLGAGHGEYGKLVREPEDRPSFLCFNRRHLER